MERKEELQIHMLRKVREFNSRHYESLEIVPGMIEEMHEFDTMLMKLESVLLHNDRINAMATIDPLELGEQMTEKAIVISSAACVWAINAERKDVQNTIDNLRAELFKTQDDAILSTCMEIHLMAEEFIDELTEFGVSNLDLQHLSILMDGYRACIESPVKNTQSVGTLLDEADTWLRVHLDITMYKVAGGLPQVYLNYLAARESIPLGLDSNSAA